jgi:hypothetical protein
LTGETPGQSAPGGAPIRAPMVMAVPRLRAPTGRARSASRQIRRRAAGIRNARPKGAIHNASPSIGSGSVSVAKADTGYPDTSPIGIDGGRRSEDRRPSTKADA